MSDLPRDCMAFHDRRPLVTKTDFSKVPSQTVANTLAGYLEFNSDNSTWPTPERSALRFYALNHAMAVIKQRYAPYQPLGEVQWIADLYNREAGALAVRAFYYLLLICTRESRHCQNKKDVKKHISENISSGAATYYGSIPDDAHSAMTLFPKKAPSCNIGKWTRAMAWAFHNGSWSSGYGGKKWAEIADVLDRFIHGVYSGEMMLDIVWTLQHNGGQIFNKSMLFRNGNGVALLRILDVQRSGQIPSLITSDDAKIDPYVKVEDDTLMQDIAGVLGEAFLPRTWVDWYAVEAAGALGDYGAEKKHQTQHDPAAVAAAKQAALEAKAKEKAEKAAFLASHVEILPNVFVKKVERAA